ncbi:MAG: hypothetical protein J0H43_01970 [Actinobacteria bacterium]|nr:hypothetical protein [Actinomycetota bacterium]
MTPPSITAVNPPSPVLAGKQVSVNGNGFDSSGTVKTYWDGTRPGDTLTADVNGVLSGAAVTVPLSLRPGAHSLEACASGNNCSAPYPIQVGPIVSTTATQPLKRGATITVQVAGLDAGQTAIFGWDGVFAASPAQTVPDQPSFDVTTTVPKNAPAASTFDVCEQLSGTTCITSVQTKGTLALTVTVPPPVVTTPTPTPTPTPTQVRTSAVAPPPATSPAAVAATQTPMTTPTPTPSGRVSPTPSPSPAPVLVPATPPTPSPTPAPAPSSHKAKPAPVAFVTPVNVVHTEVATFAILTVVGGGTAAIGIAGLAVPGGVAAGSAAAGGLATARRPGGGKATSAKVKQLKGASDGSSAGDDSRSWRWPGTTRLDAISLRAPVRLGPLSPLAARIAIDASYLRAMFGSASMLLPLAGVAVGALALHSTSAQPLPPSVGLLTLLAVLGVFDAFAGFLAALVFVVGVTVAGHLTTAVGVRTLLGLGVIWFAVPLIAGAARPLRRLPGRAVPELRARLADLTIGSLIGAWAVQKMIGALPGLAQRHLAITADAGWIALIVLATSATRMLLETLAAWLYPRRLSSVQPPSVPRSSPRQRIAASLLRTAVFMFVVVVFTGQHWQLWAGGALFLIPQLLSIYEDHFPNSTTLYRFYPRGLLKLVVMLFVGAAIGALVLDAVGHSSRAALNAFVLLALISLGFSIVELFARDGTEPEEGWVRWLAGIGVLAAGLLFVFGYIS